MKKSSIPGDPKIWPRWLMSPGFPLVRVDAGSAADTRLAEARRRLLYTEASRLIDWNAEWRWWCFHDIRPL